ncbi:succinylglutamate desuccinylase/aspartoacylase family protein [Candidatus Bipolaricaulota bacterium]
MSRKLRNVLHYVAVIALAVIVSAVGATAFEPTSHDIRPGPGVHELRWLSDYHPSLKGTPGDTPVYVMQGEEPGGSFLMLGGTHSNEIAGVMAAVLLVERGRVAKGTVYVIPHANNSGTRMNDQSPLTITIDGQTATYYDPYPLEYFEFTTPSGEARAFHYGTRTTQLEDQGIPDPEVYVHAQTGYELTGWESRNLNRAYPGVADGTLTQQIAYGITQLVITEDVNVVLDLHEAPQNYRIADMVICHPRALDIGLFAILDLEAAGLPLKIEQSSEGFRGLSHRELGDHTNAYAFLIESSNPAMNWILDPDANDYPDPLENMGSRVWLDLKALQGLLSTYAMFEPQEDWIELVYPFDLDDLEGAYLGDFLR